MPKGDLHKSIVIRILEKVGWRIFADPFSVPFGRRNVQIVLGIERLIGIERDHIKCLVEIKSFSSGSLLGDLERAIGQYAIYKLALELKQIDYLLYLTFPESTYAELNQLMLNWLITGRLRTIDRFS